MRTTLDIDDDVLQAAKELAEAQGVTAGRAVSNLLRKALEPSRGAPVRNGVPLLPLPRPGVPKRTMRLVNQLRDEP